MTEQFILGFLCGSFLIPLVYLSYRLIRSLIAGWIKQKQQDFYINNPQRAVARERILEAINSATNSS